MLCSSARLGIDRFILTVDDTFFLCQPYHTLLPVFIGVAALFSSHGCVRFQQVHIDSDLRPLDEFPLRSHL